MQKDKEPIYHESIDSMSEIDDAISLAKENFRDRLWKLRDI